MPAIGMIEGTVLDSTTNKPIEYVSVSLVSIRTNDIVTGGISNPKGEFHINDIPLGQYNVVIEFIGYTPKTVGPILLSPRGEGIEQNLGQLYLSSTSLELSEIDVEGERPLFSQTIEKKIFNVEQNTLSTGGSALDVLRQVPGVDVDIDGNVSVRGNSNVNILLDGKPSSMTSGDSEMLLENIPADNIQDVEVLTNPSAKYDPDGMAGIINIVLKENKFAGLNGNLNSTLSSNGGINGSGQVNFRNEKVNAYINSGIRKDVRGASGDTHKETFSPDTVMLDQSVSGDRGGESFLIKAGLEYYLTRKTTVGLTISRNNRTHDHSRRVDAVEMDTTTLEYYRNSVHGSDRVSNDLTISFDQKFTDPKQTLSALAFISSGSNDYYDEQESHPLPGYEGLVDALPEKSDQIRADTDINLQVDYVHPLGKEGKIEAGYKGIINTLDTDYETFEWVDSTNSFVLDPDRSNHFIFEENIQSAYSQLSHKIGPFGYMVGLRMESATNLSRLEDTDKSFKNPYTSLFPSGSISYGPPKLLQVQASYSKRIRRPRSRQLNPTIRQFDQYSMRTGNPFLKPEYIDVSELNFSLFKNGLSFSLGFYYRNVTDRISRHKFSNDEGVTVVTYANYDNTQSYGTEFILSGSLGKQFRIMLSSNIYTDETQASGVSDEDISHTSTGYNGRFTTTWMMTPTTELMLMGFYRSPRDIPFGEIKSMSFTSLSLKKKFARDRFSVSFRMNDLFNTMGFRYTTWDDHYFQDMERKFESQVLSVSLEYRFGKMEDRSRYSRRNQSGNGGGEDFEME